MKFLKVPLYELFEKLGFHTFIKFVFTFVTLTHPGACLR